MLVIAMILQYLRCLASMPCLQPLDKISHQMWGQEREARTVGLLIFLHGPRAKIF